MGLAERRAVAEYQKNVFPKWQKAFDDFLGYHLEIEADWANLGLEGTAEQMENGLDAIYFVPLMEALQQIAPDDFGKEALKEGFHKYTITGIEPADRIYYKFSDKTLSYAMSFCNTVNYVNERKQRIVNILEEKL
ncbi:MAG: hypothetical protein A3J37_08640 [Alphaproteobacteria bacterium RIFCSPHIGHO2_12_FULL_45_9]|nr:MAG: hypothetical protein A3B66_01325 [Alphaproteobacteria bacterium RIFCSPHIGHO2_02_FULL_46_13]OFW98218.1 MAG: hypothetical protein A3J37_08640 [Alphaproteobacteria bacterium RIFCSPHIGHO2_12_FULL_45_9]